VVFVYTPLFIVSTFVEEGYVAAVCVSWEVEMFELHVLESVGVSLCSCNAISLSFASLLVRIFSDTTGIRGEGFNENAVFR